MANRICHFAKNRTNEKSANLAREASFAIPSISSGGAWACSLGVFLGDVTADGALGSFLPSLGPKRRMQKPEHREKGRKRQYRMPFYQNPEELELDFL